MSSTDDARIDRIRARFQRGVEFLDSRDKNWRAVVIAHSLPKTRDYVINHSRQISTLPRRIDERHDKESVIARYVGGISFDALKRLRISRNEAEELGFYFAEANPHNEDEINREYAVLTRLWNDEIYGAHVSTAPAMT